ncbi:MAG TPA: DUF5655 domain-containing protein [Mycobacteriales bacterium]|jgi:hypothetical protein|nr:DUF5655 domain-containing protein [Mycobacteriales bacterium]
MSAQDWSVERHLEGKPQLVQDLYWRFIELAEGCGPFEYSVTKTVITLKGSRRGFAGAVPKSRWLGGYLDLQRQVTDRRIRSNSPYTKRLFVHQFHATTIANLDDEFAGWLQEAYAVGQGAHLGGG